MQDGKSLIFLMKLVMAFMVVRLIVFTGLSLSCILKLNDYGSYSSVCVSNLEIVLFIPAFAFQIYVLTKYHQVKNYVQKEAIKYLFSAQYDSFTEA